MLFRYWTNKSKINLTFPQELDLQHDVFPVPEPHSSEHANETATISLRHRALWSQQYSLDTLFRGRHRRTAVVVCAVYVRSSLHLGQNADALEMVGPRVGFRIDLSLKVSPCVRANDSAT